MNADCAEENTIEISKKSSSHDEIFAEIHSKFDGYTEALNILNGIDLSGKIAVITGANSGIGYETALSLAAHGCHVILACRNLDAANKAITNIRQSTPQSKCTALKLDLTSLKSVEECALELKKLVERVDILILNAGVFGVPYSVTKDGYESTFQICHLAHFYLTLLVEPLLMKRMNSRVVIVSSESHRMANLSKENISMEMLSPSASKFLSRMSYNNAKLCNILFANALHRKWNMKGVSVYVVHPGTLVSTNIFRSWLAYRMLVYVIKLFTKSLQQAASTTILCATYSQLANVSGFYYNNCNQCNPSPNAADEELADKLWSLTEEIISKHIK